MEDEGIRLATDLQESARRRPLVGALAVGGLALLATGGYMLWRRNGATRSVMRKSVRINRPPMEVYAFWRNLENLPKFIPHLDEVTMLDEKRSRWRARGVGGVTVEWQAETLQDNPRKMTWRSVEGSQVENAGAVLFRPANGGSATDLKVTLTFTPPVGGAVAGAALAPYLSSQLGEDLERLKQILESGGDEMAAMGHA